MVDRSGRLLHLHGAQLTGAVLLLIFWYCHKRGKEVRLEKEREMTQSETEAIRQQVEADPAADYVEPTTTTAPAGASLEEVRRGAEEARQARGAAAVGSAGASGAAPESSRYAANGSLALALRKDEQTAEQDEAQAGKQVERAVES